MRYMSMLVALLLLFAGEPKAQDVNQDLSYVNNGALGFYIGYPIGGITGIYNPTSFGLGFGAGAGVEYSWQSFSEDLPPIWGSAELGITSWDSAGGATTRVTFSAGIYYYF